MEAAELGRELTALRDAGFGGVEIQTLTFGLTPREIAADPRIRTAGTPEFFERVRVAAGEAKRLGMGFDFTLGSGWSGGGPFICDAAEQQLLMTGVNVSGPRMFDGALPLPQPPAYRNTANAIMNVVGPFDEEFHLVAVTAARRVDSTTDPPEIDSFADITATLNNGRVEWQVPDGRWRLFAFYRNRTHHAVAGGAYPGPWDAALIVDHLDPAGTRKLIEAYAEPLVKALGPGNTPADAVFVDSFELVAELPWTPAFLDRFRQQMGYDLTRYLPLVFIAGSESKYSLIFDPDRQPAYAAGSSNLGRRIREDYESVRSRMFIEAALAPVVSWAQANGMPTRIQTHGGYADILDAYELADIPESEGLYGGGTYDFLKLAASAAHTAGHQRVSSETYTSITRDPLALTREDFHLLAGRALSAGINRIIYQGYPYRYVRESGRLWYPFPGQEGDTLSPGPLPIAEWMGEDQPLWPEMPRFNRYLARLSYVQSLGAHRADVAWLFNDWEFPDRPALNTDGFPPEEGESPTSLALKRAGFVYDRISRRGLERATMKGGRLVVGAAAYDALLLSDLDVASPEMMKSIERIATAGIPVLLLGDLPLRAPGFADHTERDAAVRASSERLKSKVTLVSDPGALGAALGQSGLRPPVAPVGKGPLAFALDHRATSDGDIFVLFNESSEDRNQALRIGVPAARARVRHPESGEVVAKATTGASGVLSIEVAIPARRAAVLLVER